MEPHRSSYPDDVDPRWYRGEQQYAEPGAHSQGGPSQGGHVQGGHVQGGHVQGGHVQGGHSQHDVHLDEGGYRPDRRGGGRMPPGAHTATGAPLGQWGGDAFPPAPAETAQRDLYRDPAVVRETPRSTGRAGRSAPDSTDGNRGGRFLAAIVITVSAAACALPVVRILLSSAFGPELSASGVISSLMVLLGLPLGAVGFYGLATGAARTADVPATHTWLRPPVAYLAVALVLFVAAGLAVR